MGNLLEKPIVEKDTEVGTTSCKDICWGVSSMQGWRLEMEDAHVAKSTLEYREMVRGVPPPNNLGPPQPIEGHALFCVMDGHGGKFAATHASENLPRILGRQGSLIRYAKQQEENQDDLEEQLELLKTALRDTLLELDRELYLQVEKGTPFVDKSSEVLESVPLAECGLRISTPQLPEEDSGTTLVLLLVTPQHIVCANLGDSRASLCQTGATTIPLSHDHKPSQEEERIVAAGGFVEDGRVDGDLAVSRALGDFRFKVRETVLAKSKKGDCHKVSAIPEIMVHERNVEKDLFVIAACDGIWDVFNNEECADAVSQMMREGESNMGLVCEELLDTCLERGSQDNMTALILRFPAQSVGEGGGVQARRNLRDIDKRKEQIQEEETNESNN